MFKTRTRMVSFRLSEEEYERLKDLSLMECARSVSDFARAVLCRMPGDVVSSPEPAPRIDRLEASVQQLRVELQQLRQLVEALTGRDHDLDEEDGMAEMSVSGRAEQSGRA